MQWSAITAASTLGALSRLPRVATSRAAIDQSYWRRSLPGFADGWVPVVHVGNPSHTRKVIIFWVGADRRFKAVTKIPLVAGAVEAILNEANTLEHLRGAAFLPGFLFRDTEKGIAAQSWLPGKPVSRELTAAHMELLAGLALPGQSIRVCDLRPDVTAALERADFPYDRSVLSRGLELLEDYRPLPAFIEHRDFAPWNLKRLAGGKTGAIDWEWTSLRSLPCQDLFRYFYIQDALFNGSGQVWQALQAHPLVKAHYRRFDLPSKALAPLAMYYLLRVLSMDWLAGSTKLVDYTYGQIKLLLEKSRFQI